MNWKLIPRLLLPVAAVVLVLLVLHRGYTLEELTGAIERLKESNPPAAGLLTIGGFWLGMMFFITIPLLIVSAAALHGPLFGIFYSVAGLLSGAAVFYGIGRSLHGAGSLERFKMVAKVKKQFARIQPYGVWAVALTRMVPSGPFLVVNLVTGILGFTPFQFVSGSLIGLLPSIIAFSFFGNALIRGIAERNLKTLLFAVPVFILYVSVILCIVWFVRSRKMGRQAPSLPEQGEAGPGET